MNDTDNQEPNTKRMLWVVGGAIVIALLVVGGVIYAVLGSGTNQEQATTDVEKSQDKLTSVKSTAEIEEDVETLKSSIEQLRSDMKSARAAINHKQLEDGS